MDDKVHTTKKGGGNGIQLGLWGGLFLILGARFLIHTGYEYGAKQSRKILKRHDRDVRRMFKREKQIYKEQRKRENEERARRLWFKNKH